MDKATILKAIESAKKSHEVQMVKIEMAMNNEEVDTPPALDKTKCTFGIWLYNNPEIKEVIGAQFHNTIETLHTKWHLEYFKIFNIYFKDKKKKGFFSKILSKQKIDDLELDKAKLYYTDLKDTTKELLQKLDASYRRVDAMSDSKFD